MFTDLIEGENHLPDCTEPRSSNKVARKRLLVKKSAGKLWILTIVAFNVAPLFWRGLYPYNYGSTIDYGALAQPRMLIKDTNFTYLESLIVEAHGCLDFFECTEKLENIVRKSRHEIRQGRLAALGWESKRQQQNILSDDLEPYLIRKARSKLGANLSKLFTLPKESRFDYVEDINIVGLRKAGSSQMYHIIATHPGARRYHHRFKERCPLRSLSKDRIALDKELPRLTESQLQAQRLLFRFYSHRSPGPSPAVIQDPKEKSKLSINGCVLTTEVATARLYFQMMGSTIPANKKLIHLFRDPADWLWSSFNFWTCPGDTYHGKGKWTKEGISYRSPETFHELIASGNQTKCGKKLLEDLHLMWEQTAIGLGALVGKENVLVLRSEDMAPGIIDRPGGVLDQLANFTGLERTQFNSTVYNSIHNCNAHKGVSSSCDEKSTAYPIAGNREMFPQTRQLIYLHYWSSCKLIAKELGIIYHDCLNIINATADIDS